MKTIYVATTGDDSNDGLSRGSAYRTIDKASHAAATGDTIYIESGTYNETIIPQHNGVSYTGERGHNGEWQTIIDPSIDPSTIIDPSTHVSNAWTSELLDGVTLWKIKLGYQP